MHLFLSVNIIIYRHSHWKGKNPHWKGSEGHPLIGKEVYCLWWGRFVTLVIFVHRLEKLGRFLVTLSLPSWGQAVAFLFFVLHTLEMWILAAPNISARTDISNVEDVLIAEEDQRLPQHSFPAHLPTFQHILVSLTLFVVMADEPESIKTWCVGRCICQERLCC